MIIHSQTLGNIDIDPARIIQFPEGIPAFEEEKEFILIPLEEGPFCYLQSVNNSRLCLLMADPFVFFPGYQIDLPDEEIDKIEAQDHEKNLAVYAIISVPEDFRQSTANLMAPVIINMNRQKGLQFISSQPDYKTKHLLFPADQKVKEEGK
jgi:flagellar assembly factor FliW